MRMLVTGGAGFIGAHLVAALVRQGATVRVLDNLSSGRASALAGLGDDVELIVGDIRDPGALRSATRGADTVFHLAALVSVAQSVEQPLEAAEVNATGTLRVLDACRTAGVRRFVQASTCAVYGDTASRAIRETDAPSPRSPYAASKLAAEQFGQLYARLYGLETVALRFFNVYGPGQEPGSPYAAVVPRFLERLRDGRPLLIYGDGQQSRDFVYVGDVVQALIHAAAAPGVAGEVFNIGRGEPYSVLALAQLLGEILASPPQLDFAPAREGEVRHSWADVSRISAALGFCPQTDLRSGLVATVAAAG